MLMLVLYLQRLLQLAWIPEFPNNFRHPCTTMPWTIWPALVVLWGVCWMFYNGEGVRDIYNHAISQEFEIDWSWPLNETGDLPHETPFDINLNSGPPLPYDSATTSASMSTIISQTTREPFRSFVVKSPQIGFAAIDKQANAGLFNDGLWNRGVPPTVVQRGVSPTVALQTQLNVTMEREGFGSKKELQRHESSKHSDDKPFVCTWPQCKRSRQGWAREDNYHRHVRTVHHGEYGPTTLPSRAGDVPNSSASRKRRREKSEDDAESDYRSTSRGKDEKIRDLEEICKAYKELYANSKEENIRLKEEIAQLKGIRASAECHFECGPT
ncbi:hypothetical protein DL768_004360 [Monosporascus sp. mg162]|nr:hypothetical protein DL768_004360 [Monosporascus sp. mg162]